MMRKSRSVIYILRRFCFISCKFTQKIPDYNAGETKKTFFQEELLARQALRMNRQYTDFRTYLPSFSLKKEDSGGGQLKRRLIDFSVLLRTPKRLKITSYVIIKSYRFPLYPYLRSN